MILSQSLKRISLKVGLGAGVFGFGIGTGYFFNSNFCDAPNKVLQNDTGLEFDDKISDFKLLGVGVRQVTFINFNAYAVALYMHSKSILNLGSRWREEYTPAKLLDSPESEFFTNDLLKKGNSLKIVIKTARNTDGPHLRNGFLKMLNLKFKSSDLNPEEKDQVERSLQSFKSSWPVKGTFKKGSSVVVTRDIDESLSVEFPDNPEFSPFRIENRYLSRWFFQSYVGRDGISKSLRESVSVGLQNVLLG